MIRAGIIGGAGYTAGELVRILVNHPEAEIAWIHSESQAGKPVAEHHPGLVGDTDLVFTDVIDLEGIDVLFLCSAHGKSRAFWEEHPCPPGLKVIDLAQDFRDESDGYVYGLPELNRDRISRARKVANPGCFATAIQLALLPLAKACLLGGDVHVQAVTGSTGAGVKPAPTTHFSWRSDNLSIYKVLTHQHLLEIRRNLGIGDNLHSGPGRFRPRHLRRLRNRLLPHDRGSVGPVQGLLRRCPLYLGPFRSRGPQAGGQHEQVPHRPGNA